MKRIGSCGSFAVHGFVCALALALVGCSTLTQTPEVYPPATQGPTVDTLLDHIACELADAMRKRELPKDSTDPLNAEQRLWAHLKNDNFVATVNLTLTVTDNEGVNPSIGYSQPLAFFGGGEQDAVKGASYPYHRNASLGGQYTRFQDKNFVANYFIDLARIEDVATKEKCPPVEKDARDRVGTLGGSLRLDETVGNGLSAIHATSKYSIYSAVGPKSEPDTAVVAGARDQVAPKVQPQGKDGAEAKQPARIPLFGDLVPPEPLAPPKVVAAPEVESSSVAPRVESADSNASGGFEQSGAAFATGGGGVASFTTKIDFNVAWGVNGGLGWTLLKETGPAGSSAPLLSYAKTSLDSISITMAPTCRSNDRLAFTMSSKDGKGMTIVGFEPGKSTDVHTTNLLAKSVESITLGADIATGEKDPPTVFTSKNPGTVVLVSPKPAIGSVAWSGYASASFGEKHERQTAHLVGVVSNLITSAPIGKIDLTGHRHDKKWTWDVVMSGTIEADAFENFARTSSAWQGVSNCDAVTPGGLMNVSQSLVNQNVIVRLPAAQRAIFNQ